VQRVFFIRLVQCSALTAVAVVTRQLESTLFLSLFFLSSIVKLINQSIK